MKIKNLLLIALIFMGFSQNVISQDYTDKWTSNQSTRSADDELIDIAVNTTLAATQAGSVASISRSLEMESDSGDENEIRIDYHDEDGTLEWSNTDVVGDGMPVKVFIDGGSVMGVSNFDIGQGNNGVTFHGYTFSGTRKTGYPRSFSTAGGVEIADATIVNGIIHAIGYINTGPSNKNMILVRSQISNTSGTIYTATYGDSNEDEMGRAIAGTSTHSFSLVEDGDIMRVLKFNNTTGTNTPEVTRSYTVSSAIYGEVVGIKALDENNVFAVFEEDGDYILKKYDLLSSYTGEFDTRITDLDDVRDFYVDASGNSYLTGYDGLRLFLAKYNSSGVRQYLVYGSAAIGSSGSSVFTNDDGNIVVAGKLTVASVSSPGIVVFDTDGEELLLHQYDENSGTASILKAKQGPKNSVVMAREYNKASNYDSRKLWTICDLPSATFSKESPIMEVDGSVYIEVNPEAGASAIWDHNGSFSGASFYEPGYYTASVGYSGTQFNCDNVVSVLVRSNQNISFSSLPNKTTLDDDFSLTASSTSGLDIEYTSSDPSVATISGDVVTIVGAGSTTITATQSGTTIYIAASSVQRTLNVSKVSQTLDWSLSSPVTITQSDLENTIDAFISKSIIQTNQGNNANSLVSSDPSVVAIVDAGTAWELDYKKAGTVTLTATVDEDDVYLAVADDVDFSLEKTDQSVHVTNNFSSIFFGEDPIGLNVSAFGSQNSGNQITVTLDDPSILSISGETLTIEGVGTTTLRANQPGNDLFNDATEFATVVTVRRASFSWAGSSWYNPNNVSRSYPVIEDHVSINASYETAEDGEFNAYSLDIGGGDYSLIVSDGHTLEVTTDITIYSSATVTIESGASLITYEGNTIDDNFEIYRTTRYDDGRYSFVGTPVEQSASIIGEDLGTNVYKYNEVTPFGADGINRWVNASTDELIPGKGYTQANLEDLSFRGRPNTGTIIYSGTYTQDALNANEGWNLVANPYAAAINATDFLNANMNTSGSLYLWDDNGSDNQRGTNADYIVANGTMASSTQEDVDAGRYNNHIGSAQAFFVKLNNAANTDITFTETMRRADLNGDANFFRETELPIVRLNLTDNQGLFKQAVVGFADDASDNELNRMYDAQAFNASSDFGLFTMKAGRSLTLNGMTRNWESMQLQLNVKEAGHYQIAVQLENYDENLYLKDNLTGEIIDLRNGEYSFTAQAGISTDRFELLSNPSTVLRIEESNVLVYANNSILHIKQASQEAREYQLFNMNGQKLLSTSVKSNAEVNLSEYAKGIYLVFDGEKTHKIILD